MERRDFLRSLFVLPLAAVVPDQTEPTPESAWFEIVVCHNRSWVDSKGVVHRQGAYHFRATKRGTPPTTEEWTEYFKTVTGFHVPAGFVRQSTHWYVPALAHDAGVYIQVMKVSFIDAELPHPADPRDRVEIAITPGE